MKNEILSIIKNKIEKTDIDLEQESLAKEFFTLSELVKSEKLYDIIMDSYLLAKYSKYEKNLYTKNKEEILKELNDFINKF